MNCTKVVLGCLGLILQRQPRENRISPGLAVGKWRVNGESQRWPAPLSRIAADTLRTLGGASPHNKVKDERNDRENQQQVDETACHVKHGESAYPCDQQYDEQYRPDAHV